MRYGPAEQLVDGQSAALAENVPEREFNSRDCRAFDHAAAPEFLSLHDLTEVLNACRVFAGQQIFEIAEQGNDGVCITSERRFAESGDSLIGVNADEEIVLVGELSGSWRGGSDDNRFNLRDFHSSINSFAKR